MLVDAKGVARLYEPTVRRRDLVFLVLSALLVVVVIVLFSDPAQVFLDGVRVTVQDLWYSITDRF
jgi:hypothetical protein